ncbi:MAG TPA: DUF2461 domain-containing protein [Terriglobales bacterium]
MDPKFPGFSPQAITFLRNLARNNRREWFQPRKEQYESLIKAPMLELVECLNRALAEFAPNYVTPPQKAVFRIYRDTRFSANKTPYKTHVAAIFPLQNVPKNYGAAFYFHFTAKELLVFGGLWTPEREELLAVRRFLQEHYSELEELLRNRARSKILGTLQGEQLTRMPAGFPSEHPAESLLRRKQWYLEATTSDGVITTSRLLPELTRRFQLMAPVVEFLNRPFIRKKEKPRKLMFMAF